MPWPVRPTSSRKCALRNADVPADRRIEFRIGVNLGDIIIEDDDIFGDGVNIAARIQSIAEPGGVAVSALGQDQICTGSNSPSRIRASRR